MHDGGSKLEIEVLEERREKVSGARCSRSSRVEQNGRTDSTRCLVTLWKKTRMISKSHPKKCEGENSRLGDSLSVTSGGKTRVEGESQLRSSNEPSRKSLIDSPLELPSEQVVEPSLEKRNHTWIEEKTEEDRQQ